jgi:hypothetical protein
MSEGCARMTTSRGLQRLLAEFAQRVAAALEQLARDRQARAICAQSLRRLAVVVAVGAAGASGGLAASNNAQRSAGGPCRLRCPGARRWSD